MNKISLVCGFACMLALNACEAPPSKSQIINKVKQIIIKNHHAKKITKVQIKREDDGYEIDIVADGDIYEVDCTFYGFCEEDEWSFKRIRRWKEA